MKKYLMPTFLGLTLIIAGCGNESASNEIDIKEFVSELSASNTVESASINDKNLVVQDGGNEDTYTLPENEFFVSVAPYLTYTHPCEFHSLTGCQGELVNEKMDVKITDDEGEIYVDETLTTLENGFLDFWLPRDKNYTMEISYHDKTVNHDFSTFEGDSTCLTDLQLK
ncbi:CueP family metal-binding protein [Jeotgalicoccus huakuii]|nr:CueP family metal-binding protein [Jeotgalicoccus huakuii]